jgi:hypothetical protein
MARSHASSHPLDAAGPLIAKWLAPYLAAELGLSGPERAGAPPLSDDYDDPTCEAFVAQIGTPVLDRGFKFFATLSLAGDRGVDSLQVAKLLGVASPRSIASMLTTPMKRRAKTLGLPVPWDERVSSEDRTVWVDRDGIAERMRRAFEDEEDRRLPHPADELGGPRDLAARRALAEQEPTDTEEA